MPLMQVWATDVLRSLRLSDMTLLMVISASADHNPQLSHVVHDAGPEVALKAAFVQLKIAAGSLLASSCIAPPG